MAVKAAHLLTADEFFALPGELRYTELIDGEIVVNEPLPRHQRIVGWIYYRLMAFVEDNPGIGEPGLPVDTPIDDYNVFGPDVWWTKPEHILARDAKRADGVPDLVVEVRSPNTWRYDIGPKKDHYEVAGLPELWLVDTESDTVTVHRRSSPDSRTFDGSFVIGAGEILTTPIIPGFELDLTVLFDR